MSSLTEELNFELQYSILINVNGNSHTQLAATLSRGCSRAAAQGK